MFYTFIDVVTCLILSTNLWDDKTISCARLALASRSGSLAGSKAQLICSINSFSLWYKPISPLGKSSSIYGFASQI